jgi:hypothetical protein
MAMFIIFPLLIIVDTIVMSIKKYRGSKCFLDIFTASKGS